MGKPNKYPKKEYKRLYEIYHGMKKRCYKTTCDRYSDYGGRNITVCDEWLEGGVDAFIDWALANGYRDDLTIDRIDNEKGYSPENCRWATYSEQARNTRRTRYVTYQGITKSLADWCDELNLPYDNMHDRIVDKGWSAEKAFTTKINHEKSFTQLCREHGMKTQTVYDRVHKLGWDIERALNTPSVGRGANQKTYQPA